MRPIDNINAGAFNLAQAAEFLGVSTVTLRVLLHDRDHPIPAYRIGRRWVIPKTALIRWMEEQAAARRGVE